MQQVRTAKGRRLRSPPRKTPLSPLDKAKAREVIWNQVAPVFGVACRIEGASFVYFIGEQDDGPVKIGLAKAGEDLNTVERKQFTRAKRTAVAIVKSGEAGDAKATFDIALSGHSPTKDEEQSRPAGITVSVAADQVGGGGDDG